MKSTASIFADDQPADVVGLADRDRVKRNAPKAEICRWRDCKQPVTGHQLRTAVRISNGLMHAECHKAQTQWALDESARAIEEGRHVDTHLQTCGGCSKCWLVRGDEPAKVTIAADGRLLCGECVGKAAIVAGKEVA